MLRHKKQTSFTLMKEVFILLMVYYLFFHANFAPGIHHKK